MWHSRGVEERRSRVLASHVIPPIFFTFLSSVSLRCNLFSSLSMAVESRRQKAVIVGAGPVGSLAALYAAARGDDVELYELRGGRSSY